MTKLNMREIIIMRAYINYIENFTSVEAFAQYYDLDIEKASMIIYEGRAINARFVKESNE